MLKKKKTINKPTIKETKKTKEKVAPAAPIQPEVLATPLPKEKVEDVTIERILCFTTSYKRPYELYHCINSILTQKHEDFKYCVSINIDERSEEVGYQSLLAPLTKDKRLQIVFNQNQSQHDNYLAPIKHAKYEQYNLFIKIDDDDIYSPNYISTMLKEYKKHKIDILSCSTKHQINGANIQTGNFASIGVWQKDTESSVKFGMPFTYVFNKRALAALLKTTNQELAKIHHFEDPGWRTKWREAGLTSYVLGSCPEATYNIHGKNTSSSYLHSKDGTSHECIDNEHFAVCSFEHQYWTSYVYLNKRNNRMYHISNDDHGGFKITDNEIVISWDDWGEEIFYKKQTSETSYYYASHK